MYVNDFGSLAPLVTIYTIGTGGFQINDGMPEQYEPVADNSIQTGLRAITVNMAFYYDPTDLNIIKLARGLNIANLDQNAGSDFGKYTLLLAHPDDAHVTSILLPKCYTIKKYSPNFEKTAVTKVELQFVAFDRNRYIDLFNQDTLNNLGAILGPRSPLA